MGEEIRAKVSELLLREVKDARLLGVHLTRVELSRDLAAATLYWRPTPGEATEDAAAEALERAARFLRARVGRTLRLRKVPEMIFELDGPATAEGGRIDMLLASIARAQSSSGPASGADPRDRDEVDDAEE